MQYDFDWDPFKAKVNIRKHGVSFEQAALVFLDPRALTLFDSEHSRYEERWVTLGLDKAGRLIVVCHTFRDEGGRRATVRIYSARNATRNEKGQYLKELK